MQITEFRRLLAELFWGPVALVSQSLGNLAFGLTSIPEACVYPIWRISDVKKERSDGDIDKTIQHDLKKNRSSKNLKLLDGQTTNKPYLLCKTSLTSLTQ